MKHNFLEQITNLISNHDQPTEEWVNVIEIGKGLGIGRCAITERIKKREDMETRTFLINGKWKLYCRIKPNEKKEKKNRRGGKKVGKGKGLGSKLRGVD